MSSAADARDGTLVSVIVPVFNGEAHLDECVRSIVAQRHPSLDIILVDDGSADATPRLCDDWAGADSRVRVLHTANGGLSRARNRGLDIASGEYVTFVDADDVLGPDHIAQLVEIATESGVGLVAADLIHFADGGDAPVFRGPSTTRTTSGDDALKEIVRRGVGFASCGKLMGVDLFGDVRFRPGADFEDLEILPRLMARATVVAVTDAANYGYRQHPTSLMGVHRRLLRASLLDVLSSNIEFAAERYGVGSADATSLRVWYVMHGLRILEGAARSGVRRESGYDRAWRRFMTPHIGVLLRSHELTPLYKVAIAVAIVSPDAFTLAFRAARKMKATIAPNLRRAERPGARPLQS